MEKVTLKEIMATTIAVSEAIERKCPNCGNPIEDGKVYRAGYEWDNLRTIPPRYGRGKYCDHIDAPAI